MISPLWTETDFRSNPGEDHLGSLSVGVNIAEILMPGINTVTPRARYRSFYCWVLLDFINSNKDRSRSNFKSHLQKREMAYIFANLLSGKEEDNTTGIIGSTKGREILATNPSKLKVDQSYVRNENGGYAIYRGSMISLRLINDAGDANYCDALLPKGLEIANAFKESIKDTEYYREYLDLKEIPVAVLREFGQKASLFSLYKHEDSSKLLNAFFRYDLGDKRREVNRRESLAYLLEIIHQNPIGRWKTNKAWRSVLLNYEYEDKITFNCPEELKYAQIGWHIYQLRQYFTFALETIFCYIIENLHLKSTNIFGLMDCLKGKIELNILEGTLIIEQEYLFESLINELPRVDLEKEYSILMKNEIKEINFEIHVCHSLIMLCDIYKSVKSIKNLEFCRQFLMAGGEDHLSLAKFAEDVDHLIEKKANFRDLYFMILTKYIIQQHHRVALEKLLNYGLETFRITENNGLLEYRSDYFPNFNQFRGHQAITILEDLGLIKRNNNLFEVTELGKESIENVKKSAVLIKSRNWGDNLHEED